VLFTEKHAPYSRTHDLTDQINSSRHWFNNSLGSYGAQSG